MYYTVHHVTRFRYSAPITESIMEVRIQPRNEGYQRCLDFRLHTNPKSQIMSYRDELGNRVHHFDVPNRHTHLSITAEAIVELTTAPALPDALSDYAWDELDVMTAQDQYWDMLESSRFTQPSELLHDLMRELNIQRRDDPLSLLRTINTAIYDTFEYAKKNTRVDSPIDDALSIRRGVCQDFAHIMIAIGRELRIPCRYVSGYLFHSGDRRDRSADGATHAWVEALLPGLGWVGFDPTNNTLVGERHVVAAIGRDYDDVPPTRGTYKGGASSEPQVSVRVSPSEAPPPPPPSSADADETTGGGWAGENTGLDEEQQQQQQQQ